MESTNNRNILHFTNNPENNVFSYSIKQYDHQRRTHQ